MASIESIEDELFADSGSHQFGLSEARPPRR
jgi:hypothetical protein